MKARKSNKGYKKNGKVFEKDFNIVKKLLKHDIPRRDIKMLTGWSTTVIDRIRVNDDWASYKEFVSVIAHKKPEVVDQEQPEATEKLTDFEKTLLEILAEMDIKLDTILENKNKKGWF